MGSRLSGKGLGSPVIFPVLLLSGIGIAMAVLTLQITLRPWAGSNEGTDTHFNYGIPEADYSRSEISTVGLIPHSLDGWFPSQAALDEPTGEGLYVGNGCASCHGLLGEGDVFAPELFEASEKDVRENARDGEVGMPIYGNPAVLDDDLSLISEYLKSVADDAEAIHREQAALAPLPPPVPTPYAVPTPTPSPAPTAIPPTPSPVPADAIPVPTVPTDRTPEPTERTPIPDGGTPVAETPVATPVPATPLPLSPTPPPPEPTQESPAGPVKFNAVNASITVDGQISDWAGIEGGDVELQQIMRIPGKDMGEIGPVSAHLKLATDGTNVYVLFEIEDDYDWTDGDASISSKPAVMFRIDPPAAPHMGTTEEDQKKSLGTVDIWHWELDCGPGIPGGGAAQDPAGISGGNDRECNLDDEYAATPKDLEDDGSVQAENSILGVWDHTGKTGGIGSGGKWVFEFSRPLTTNDPHDAQFVSGAITAIALAYWDADETASGWTDLGHLQSSSGGWIEVTLP
ncbi:MAG: hypothetical protein HQ478_12905 [Chloroflexi bacterium]|nr:hypothetical protein [Chloroflexota bacterium]